MKEEILLLQPRPLSPQEKNEVLPCLASQEREAIERIKDEKKRQLKLYAHVRLYAEASARLGCTLEELIYEKGEHGKPFFANAPRLYFSLSYTLDAAVLIFAVQPVGIDIEKVRPHAMRLGKNLGTAHELSLLQAAPDDLSLFFTFWTRKEAWVKYTGSGLTVPLTSFDVWEEPLASRITTWQEGPYILSICT